MRKRPFCRTHCLKFLAFLPSKWAWAWVPMPRRRPLAPWGQSAMQMSQLMFKLLRYSVILGTKTTKKASLGPRAWYDLRNWKTPRARRPPSRRRWFRAKLTLLKLTLKICTTKLSFLKYKKNSFCKTWNSKPSFALRNAENVRNQLYSSKSTRKYKK